MTRVVAFGEVMVELSLDAGGHAVVAYGGDTFNAAVYLRRLGCETAYATALGAEDPFSHGIIDLMADEGVDADLVVRVEDRLPGLYAIQRDPAGERGFFYWRGEAPVREFFSLADTEALGAAMRGADLVYVSGITLAVIGETGRRVLKDLLAEAAAAGAAVALDLNYRPRLWTSPEAAGAAMEAVAAHCRFISASADDLGDLGLVEAPARWAAAGAEVVERAKDRRCVIRRSDDAPIRLEPNPPVPALDTTGAGDSFNAGYLAARLSGEAPEDAAEAGRRLAAVVVQHLGGVIARAAMPE